MGIIKYSRYWNGTGARIAVVASVSYLPTDLSPEHPGVPGQAWDWAAYIGGDDSETREETEAFVQKRGCKLTERVARAFFPELKAVTYRP